MNIKRISKGQMPPADKYVMGFLNERPSADPLGPEGSRWRIVRCIYGISRSERLALSESEDPDDKRRSYDFRKEDEGVNNLKPYYFEELGSGSFYGQEIDVWCELPNEDVLTLLGDV